MSSPRIRTVDTVVLGSGVAGLAAALRLVPRSVAVITKTPTLESGSSPLAQGGIAVALAAEDDPAAHADDTVLAAAGLGDAEVARVLAEDGRARIQAWLARGLPCDRDADGRPALGREAAHGRARILHAGGDATGHHVVKALLERARAQPTIRFYTETFAVELVRYHNRIVGVLTHSPTEGWVWWRTTQVILACGGLGAVYRHTTNPPEATGDGLALAARAGAALADLEFVQFHPTALAVPPGSPTRNTADAGDTAGARLPLLTEALRGAGAHLLNAAGARFMLGEHPLAELAPRDVVARAVWRQGRDGQPVYLDARSLFADPTAAAAHFPTVLGLCRTAGLDPARDLLPIVVAAHYHMGGVVTDLAGRTSLPGLWACGEVACTGVHGANRLASNSLLEALVFGERVAEDVERRPLPAPPRTLPIALPQRPLDGPDFTSLGQNIRTLMADAAGVRRDGPVLAAAQASLNTWTESWEHGATIPIDTQPEHVRAWGEARNRLLVARLVVDAAVQRRESRGAHWRADYPLSDSAWRRRQSWTLGHSPAYAVSTSGGPA